MILQLFTHIGISCDIIILIFKMSHVTFNVKTVKCEAHYPLVQATKAGTALKAVLILSKHLVAYMVGLLAVSPYVNGTFKSLAKGVAEAIAAAALSE